MKTTNKKEIKLKSGSVYSVGQEFDIKMTDNDGIALAYPTYGIGDGKPIRVPANRLHEFFKGFVKVSVNKVAKFMEEMESTGVCQSLTGETVEPDGIDQHGFPSILRAAGYV